MERALLVNTLLVGTVIVCAIAMRYGAEQNGLSLVPRAEIALVQSQAIPFAMESS